MTTPARKIADVLGGEGVLGRPVRSLGDLREAVVQGLPKDSVSHVAKAVAADRKQQRAVIHRLVPEATLKRRRDRLSTLESERTERLARIAAAAIEIFGEDDARTFMTAPHPMLRGETPLDAAATELGAREVEAILRGIEYGLPV
jgi:putative toxin-antitoxin system antitoxin component (TIGR02293 family)